MTGRRPSRLPLVKICGLTRADDALAAARGGADFLGLVFAPRSKRRVDEAAAKKIVSLVRGWYAEANAKRAQSPQCGHADPLICPPFVGVFVDESPQRMNQVSDEVGLDLIQLHGDEQPEIVPLVSRPVIRAIRVGRTAPDPSPWQSADWLMFDAARGGSGESFDWSVLRGVDRPFLLAGGLTPDNVAEALRATGAAGVDVATGVEHSPGIKDPDKVRAFIDAARSANVDSARVLRGRGQSAEDRETRTGN